MYLCFGIFRRTLLNYIAICISPLLFAWVIAALFWIILIPLRPVSKVDITFVCTAPTNVWELQYSTHVHSSHVSNFSTLNIDVLGLSVSDLFNIEKRRCCWWTFSCSIDRWTFRITKSFNSRLNSWSNRRFDKCFTSRVRCIENRNVQRINVVSFLENQNFMKWEKYDWIFIFVFNILINVVRLKNVEKFLHIEQCRNCWNIEHNIWD